MFEDVGHACRIGRVGLESDGEDIVLVLPGNVQIFGTGPIVLI